MTTPQPPLARAEALSRQILLSAGLGFFAMVVGSVLSGILIGAVWQASHGSKSVWPLLVVQLVTMRAWVWAVLPAMAYATGLIARLQPRRAAVIAVLTGEAFSLMVRVAGGGLEGLKRHWLEMLMWLLTSLGGMWLTYRAIMRARSVVERRQERVAEIAKNNRAEYEYFRQEAERLGELPTHDDKKPPAQE